MQVEVGNAGAHAEYEGQTFHFCSDHCRERFEADPARYDERALEPMTHAPA
jgi:Cu+-exporting ATPase